MSDIVDQDQWGICGFVSVLNGLRAAGKLVNFTGGQLSLEDIQTRLYAEIVTYLKYLLFTKSPLVAQIEEISNICAPKAEPRRSLQEIVLVIERRLRKIEKRHTPKAGKVDEQSARQDMRALINVQNDAKNITVAMSPDALVDYMKWAGVKNAQDLKITTTMNTSDNLMAFGNCIIGLGERPGPTAPYNGLEHWIYVDGNGVLNNWGKKTTLKAGVSGIKLFGKWAKFMTHVIRMG